MHPLYFLLLGLLAGLQSAGQASADSFAAYETTIPGSSIRFQMVPIPGGEFVLGSPGQESGRSADEGPQHRIRISPFWMGVHEVTYDEFLLYFNDETVSRNLDADAVTRPTAQYIDLSWGMGKQGGFPVNSMSLRTAMMYCRWLYGKTGQFYRLPTEAEWEYAARAGTTGPYFFTEAKDLKEYAWFADNSKKKYQKVMQKKPNPWGLYDLLGNVAEWTLDQYNENYYSTLTENTQDPNNPILQPYPIAVRGGGFTDVAIDLRIAKRTRSVPAWNRRDPQIPKSKWWLTDAMAVGFRLVRPASRPRPEEIEAYYQKYLGN